jgi:nucleoside-diphosphate-sugar epimerase
VVGAGEFIRQVNSPQSATSKSPAMKVILFGATGMVGQGVLRECLRDDGVESVLAIGRSSSLQTHPKLQELIRSDMFDVSGVRSELEGYDACFFCLGVSAASVSESEYVRMTFDLTMKWANLLAQLNPSITFVYVSGAGTGGKPKWAQVKKRTEDALLALFPSAYMFRLAALRAMHGEVSKTRWTRLAYAMTWPFMPLFKTLLPEAIITTEELGRAMIRVAREGAPKHVLENRDLIQLGR